jgi:hypothetical protein
MRLLWFIFSSVFHVVVAMDKKPKLPSPTTKSLVDALTKGLPKPEQHLHHGRRRISEELKNITQKKVKLETEIDGGIKNEHYDHGIKKEPAIKQEPGIKQEAGIKHEPAIKKEPGIKQQPGIKHEPAIKKEPGIKVEDVDQAFTGSQ